MKSKCHPTRPDGARLALHVKGATATQIENGLFRERHRADILIAFHNRAEYLHTLSAGLLAVDQAGRVLALRSHAGALTRFTTPPRFRVARHQVGTGKLLLRSDKRNQRRSR